MSEGTVGKNVSYKIDGDELIIKINLREEKEMSKSGKSNIIASSKGNASITGTDYKLGLNLYEPVKG